MRYRHSRKNVFNGIVLIASIIILLLIPLTVNLIKEAKKIQKSQASGTCFPLSYPCYEGLINFPSDEGKHTNKQVEWWYVNFNNTSPEIAGAVALVRANPGSGDEGFILLEITNEAQNTFFYRVLPGSISTNVGSLNLTFIPNDTSEISSVRLYQQGNPFTYKYEVLGPNMNINLTLASQKRPLVEGGDGYIPIFADSSEESGYYSLTRISATGTLSLPGTPQFSANAKAWMDHQWFNVPGGLTTIDPSTMRPHHEWFSIQLDNNVEIVAWQIFRETPTGLELALQNIDVLDSSNNQVHYDSFELDPKTFWTSPDGKKFSKEWRLKKDNLVDLRFQTSVANQYVEGWHTYEGSMELTSGSYNGAGVDGEGYSEMTLNYLPETPCGSGMELCNNQDDDCDYRIDEICIPSPTPTPRPTSTPTPVVSCSVTLYPLTIYGTVGQNVNLSARILTVGSVRRVEFISSDTSVASIYPINDYSAPYISVLTPKKTGYTTATTRVFLAGKSTPACSDTSPVIIRTYGSPLPSITPL